MSAKRLLLITARNDQDCVGPALAAIRDQSWPEEIWFVDDASSDRTYTAALEELALHPDPRLHLCRNPRRQGLGGNQKMVFRHALEAGFDLVVVAAASEAGRLSHLPQLLAADAVDGRAACCVGYGAHGASSQKWVNAALSRVSGVKLSAWSSTIRLYHSDALKRIAFAFNSNEFHFQTELLLQLYDADCLIREVLLPDAPGARGQPWTASVAALKAALKYRLQKYNLFYDVRYHPEILLAPGAARESRKVYDDKRSWDSPHAYVCREPGLIPSGSRVLDIGCSTGYVADWLAREKGCQVVAVDVLDPGRVQSSSFQYIQLDLEKDWPRLESLIKEGAFDVVLLLDVLEHLAMPELLLSRLAQGAGSRAPKFVVSTGNVAFIVIRWMLFLGYFNYGEKGILDVTHKRLFSVRTFQNLLDQTGFVTLSRRAFPMPFAALGFSDRTARRLERLHRGLIRLRPSLFAYQVLLVAIPLSQPRLEASTGLSLQ